MRKIFLTGYYGHSNFGDDLFQDLFKKYLEKNYKNIIVNNYAPLNTGNFSRLKRVYSMLKNILKNDIIIFAGGSILSSRGSTRMKKLQYILVRLFRKKVMAYGVSYGPFDDEKSEKFYHKFIRNLDFISLRDEYSFEKVMEINGVEESRVFYTGDIANLIPTVYELNHLKNKSTLGISLCNYEKYTKDNYEEENSFLESIVEDIKKNIHNYEEVIIFALKTGDLGDEDLAEYQYKIYSKIHDNVRVVYHENNVLNTLEEINQVSHFICMRLHAMIPSIVMGKKTLAIEYHDKCKEFLNTIDYPNTLRIPREDYTKDSFEKYLDNLKNAKDFKTGELNVYKSAYENSNAKLNELFKK